MITRRSLLLAAGLAAVCHPRRHCPTPSPSPTPPLGGLYAVAYQGSY